MIRGTNVILRATEERDLPELYELDVAVDQRSPLAPVGFSSFLEYKRDFEKKRGEHCRGWEVRL